MGWLLDSLYLFLRIFVIATIIGVVGAVVGAVYTWWNEGNSSAAWSVAFWGVLIVGAALYWFSR